MTIYFVTGNEKKFREASKLIPELEQLNIDLPEIQSIDSKEVIGAKLHEAFKHHSGPFIVDDIAVHMDCLNGLPGPLIKWFLKTMGNEKIYEIAEKLGDCKTTAVCSIGYAKDKDNISFFEGKITGKLVTSKIDGFGWDTIFQPDGFDKTFSEMSIDEKNKISMRGLAISKLKDFLQNI